MVWLTDEERAQNERERPERDRRAREKFAELTRDATCPACKSKDINKPGIMNRDAASVETFTKLKCRKCACEWYPGRIR